MKHIHKKTFVILLLVVGIAVAAFAQEQKKAPPKPTNLKVLPKNISHDSLIAVMRYWESSLGVNCGFCHAKSKTEEKRLDFASDEKHEKEIARRMLTMTEGINKKYFKHRGEEHEARGWQVNCATCHRGHNEPEPFIPPQKEEHR